MAQILMADDETTFLKATADLLRLRRPRVPWRPHAAEVLASLAWQLRAQLISARALTHDRRKSQVGTDGCVVVQIQGKGSRPLV